MAAANSGGGGVLSNLFGTSKPPQPVKYPELAALANLNIGEVGSNLGQNKSSLAQYSQDINANRGAISDLTNRYTNLAKGIQGRVNDPMARYTQLGNYLSGLINEHVTNPVTRFLSNQAGIRNAVMGVNTGSGGLDTYGRAQLSNIASRARVDALRDVINNLTPASNALFAQQQAQDASSLGLAPQELALRNQAAGQALLPLYARNQNLADLLNQSRAASDLFKGSVYGFRQPQNFWDRAGGALDAVWDKAMDAASVYASLYGGGGGGGRQSQPAQPNYQAIRESQINQGYGVPNYDASFNRYLNTNSYPYDYAQYGAFGQY